ncbi:polyketide synthase dehydratase domain-containing protein, partial [Streptomyces sp. NPDC006208]|uniref:polyketide synthase dehydratase domain-containing protein n=1 Tax=Streptomyces sp. NPDC006208 TaxID=3156734 RepID=UPI0033A41CD3
KRVELPTYAFQRERYWLTPGTGSGDVTAAGLIRVEHPVLGAALRVGDRDEWVFAGRISQDTQPWTRDHMVLGTVIVPGIAVVEMALTAGRLAGCAVADELVLEAPLVLEDDAALQVQVTIGQTGEDGRREVAIYTRPEGLTEDELREVTCHGRGWLAPETEPAEWREVWPPEGAETASVDALYAGMADLGYDYGPMFACVRAAWRRGAEVFAEIALPDGADNGGFDVHPGLLDAAMHGGLLGKKSDDGVVLPFSWSGVRLGEAGATRARVRIAPAGDSALRVDVVGEQGEPVLHVDKLFFRPVDASQLERAQGGGNALFQVDWAEVVAGSAPVRVAVLGEDYADLDALEQALADGAEAPQAVVTIVESPAGATDVAEAASAVAVNAMALVQRWLASKWLGETRLVVATRNGIGVGDEVPDVALAPVWGLVRSAQSEHPGRFLLIDLDSDETPEWGSFLDLDEPQLAVRGGRLLAPRLGRASASLPAGEAW